MTSGLVMKAIHFIRCYGQDQSRMDSKFAINLVKELYQELDRVNKENQKLKSDLASFNQSTKIAS